VSRKKRRDRVDGYEPKEVPVNDPWRDPALVEQMQKRGDGSRMDAANLDGFRNELTGIGSWQRDKTLGGRNAPLPFDVQLLTGRECGDRWRGSDLGARIVETIPDEMTREGWDIVIQPSDEDEDEAEADDERGDAFPPQQAQAAAAAQMQPPKMPLEEPDDENAEIAEELDGILEELSVGDHIWQALAYERAYGGGAILIGADDGTEDLSQPLEEDRINEVRHLTTFRGGWDGEIVAWSYYRDPTEPNYGEPEVYMVRNTAIPSAPNPVPGQQQKAAVYDPKLRWVHESRLLVFPGVSVSREVKTQLRGWGDSIFTRIDEVLSQYGQTWGGIANLMTDFSQGVLKIKDLAQSMGSNNKNASRNLTNRAFALNMTRSISRIMLIDAEEEFVRDTVSLSGIAEMMQQFSLRLAAAADMPVTLLMGQAPAGLNATGESDIRFFYDRVASKQKKRLGPKLKRLIGLILKSSEGPAGGKEPGRWNVEFRSLYQMSETEKAQLRKTVAETDQIYITQQVLTPEEVTVSAFGQSDWSMERTIDFEGRKKMAEQDAKDRKKAEKQAATVERQQGEMHEATVAKMAAETEAKAKEPPTK
jgi:phage-related protein (TIGR01555 family)